MKQRFAILLTALLCAMHVAVAEEVKLSIVRQNEAIRVSPEGQLFVGDRETALGQLANRLRREGFSPTDSIIIAIPENMPQRALVAISRELASKGYRRLLFSRPPRAVSETENILR